MNNHIQHLSRKLSILPLVAFMAVASAVQGQSTIEALEDCNCPEGTVGQRCLHDQLLDSIVNLEAAIQGYDATFVKRDYAVRQLVGNKNVGAYDCAALVDSIASLNVQLINAMGCSDSESCNYNPASTSTVNCNYPTTWYFDGDGDGLGRADSTETACDASENFVADNTDLCDDTLAYNYAADPTEACIYPPTVSALSASGLDGETATINGSLDADGGATILAIGFFFNTDENMPEGTNTEFSASLVDGEISVDLSALTVGTTYYYRVYVTTAYGTVLSDVNSFIASTGPCGGLTSITSYDGETYSLVEFADQCWTGENLRATTWSDGTALSYRPISEAIGTHPQYWVYNDDAATNLDILGYSYNYYSVYPTIIGQKEICPAGFSIPTKAAWDAVIAAADALSELPALDELMSPVYWNGQDPGSGLDLTGTGLRQSNAGGGDGAGTITPTTNQVRGWYTIGSIVPGTHIYENGSNVGTPPNIRMVYTEYNEGGGHYTSTTSYFPTNGGCAVRCVKTSTDPGIGVD